MTAVLLIAAAFITLAGSVLLALSQPRHWQAVMGREPRPARGPRPAGWLLLGLSLTLTILRDGVSFGILLWPLLIGLGALTTAMLLTWAPWALRPLASWFRS